jgi:hypothetical protein
LNFRRVIRRSVLVGALLVLAAVACGTLIGAVQQLPRAESLGQRVETAIQIACSLLSLLAIVTCFWQRRRARAIRTGWAVSLAITTGLSALVWGPPMLGVALLFAAGTLLIASALNWALVWAQAA